MSKQSVAVVAAVAVCAGLLISETYRLAFPTPSKLDEHQRLIEMQSNQIKDLQNAHERMWRKLGWDQPGSH